MLVERGCSAQDSHEPGSPEPSIDGQGQFAAQRGGGATFLPLWIASVLLPLLVFVAGAWWTWSQVQTETRFRLEQIVDLLHEHAARSFEIQDAVLAAVQGRLAGMNWPDIEGNDRVWSFLRTLSDATPTTSTIGITAPDGRLLQIANRPPPTLAEDLSDRDYVAAQMRAVDDRPFIGEAIKIRRGGYFVVPQSRPRLGADGRPDGGALWTTFRIEELTRFYGSVVFSKTDVVMLVRRDGALLAHYPPLSSPLGHQVNPDSAPMRAIRIATGAQSGTERTALSPDGRVRHGGIGFAAGPSPKGTVRLYGARELAGLPVAIVYGQGTALLWQIWLPRVAALLFVAVASSCLMMMLTWITQRGARRELLAVSWAKAEAENRASAEAARADAEAAMRNGQRLEALGQIAAGVAHDFRNVVQAVQAGAKLIQRAAAQGQTTRVHDLAGMLDEAAGRGADLTGPMLALARGPGAGVVTAAICNPAQVVQGACRLLERTLGAKYRVDCRTASDLPPQVRAGPAELEATLINLAINARDAMPKGGPIVIEASGQTDPVDLPPGYYARIVVTDSGIGMEAATLARATEAFFTTKPSGQGTGLGLATARAVAVDAGGRLQIESRQGHGTTVTLWLLAV